jgi:hypothetical protein
VVRVFPYPGQARTIDFTYRRSFRPLLYPSVQQGTATASASSSTVAISGNVSLSSALVGSVIRLSGNSAKPPTSPIGDNPAAHEGIVVDYASNVVTVDTPVLFSGGSLKYSISDPIDIEDGAMLTAFLRGIEKQLCITRVFEDRPSAAGQYETALRKAKAADSRRYTGRACGPQTVYRQRLARMPMDFNA